MNNTWDNKKIAEEIRNNGYYIFENYFNSEEIDKIKKSLLDILHYIKPDEEKDLQKKYYQIKKYNSKLKSHWYDIAPYNITMLQLLHKPEMINFVKEFFNTDVVFSGRPAIHVHDDANDKLLEPHQEKNQIARDNLIFWSPLYDTNKENGGLSIYKDSHKHGCFKHSKHSMAKPSHVDESITNKFKRIDLEIKTGSAILMLSKVIHGGYQVKKKDTIRLVITERYNPLQKIPFLKDENAPLRMLYNIDYNKIVD